MLAHRGQTQTEEAPMTPDATADGIAALVEGVTIQDAVGHTIGRPWRGDNSVHAAAADLDGVGGL